MIARIWGCRGSLAAPGPDTVRYGGNTTCVEVRMRDGSMLVLDAGTGIRPFGHSIEADPPKTIHLLLTHLHLDHLEGLGFFGPLWNPSVDLHIWGPPSPVRNLERRITRYLSPPLFPVHLSAIPSHPTFHDVPDNDWQIGSAHITAEFIKHRGPTLGYRIEEEGQCLAFLPDHEPARGTDLSTVRPEWVSGFALAREADILFHDSQYFPQEYTERAGWGHSSIEDSVKFAAITGVRQLVMFHHDPTHSDDEMDSLGEIATSRWEGNGHSPVVAREGMELDVEQAAETAA